MTDTSETIAAKDKLAGSRAALLHEMGFNALHLTAPARSTSDAFTAPVSLLAFESVDQPSPWISMIKSAVKNWWAKHPVNAALTLAKPALARYAQDHPEKIIAWGAAVGAVLYVVRPWRLLSVTTAAALVVKRSTIAGLVTRLAEHLPATRRPMPASSRVPERQL